MTARIKTALARLEKHWSRSEIGLLQADLEHFHDELEDDLPADERQDFLDTRARLKRLLVLVETLLPEDVISFNRLHKPTVLLTPPDHHEDSTDVDD